MARIEPRPTNPFPLVRVPRPCDFPLSPGQERLWWQRQLESSHDQYHVTEGWRFAAGLDREAIAAAFAGLIHRHEILRTRFVLRTDGTVVQQVTEHAPVAITWAGTGWRAAVDRAIAEPFDLSCPPLLRVVGADLGGRNRGIFVVLHHIVTDRWSMDVLERDLFELYAAAVENRPPRLSDLLVQYGDHAAWQRRFLTSDLIQPQLEYWRQALAGCERLELPLDRPRSTANDAAGDTVVVEISPEATAAMNALAWRVRASSVMVMTAAFAAALGAFTGQTDIVIGALISDRPRPALQEVIGFFVNTVILRIDLSGVLSLRDVVKRTRDAWMAADAHQDAPFEQIVGALQVGSEAQRNPIFDVVVNHAGARPGFEDSPDAPTPWEPEVPITARFDLSLHTQIVDDRLRATFLYRPSLFDRATIAALASRYARLLEHGVAAPDRPVRDLDLVQRAEREVLHRHNDTAAVEDVTIVDLVQAQAASRALAPAVVGAGGVLSYQELNRRANQLARHLLAYDVGPERVIGVCLERTVETMVVLLAIAKTGSAYFPLDPNHPIERLRFLLSDAGVILTIVSAALQHRLPPDAAPVLVLGRGEPDLTRHDTGDLPLTVRPDHLAYLISTSGSTGTPKAVAIPHRGLSRLVAGARRYLEVGPGTTFLQTGPLTFDVSVLEWSPLAHGGCVAVIDTGTLLEDLPSVLRDCRVSTLKLISPQLDLLVERDLRPLATLRQIIVGGDVVNPRSFTAIRDALPGCRVMASYGPTECTVLSTVFEDRSWTTRVPIGRAIPHTAVYVLDRDLHPASVGMRGEIYVAGDGLARGYHGRPGLTAASFLPDPYGPPGSRMYRTGDVGRYLSSGAIDFLGRADRQVKIRGYRIETGEIEHVLLRQPDIASAIVLPVALATGPALVAYVVAAGPLDMSSIRHELRAALPAYMIPDHIVELPRLPLTANNKVDRAMLPPVDAGERCEARGAAPATALEARIADAWSAVLRRTIRCGEDFFDHGGHSLLVPQATAAVRQLLGREIPLRLMMQHRTPAAYAAALLTDVLPDPGAASRGHRLEQQTWRSARFAGDRRVDLFVTEGDASARAARRMLVVVDGSDFVDILRLPAILERLVVENRIPTTAAIFVSPTTWPARNRELLDDAFVDVLADELLPHLRSWLGERWQTDRATVVGASLGGVTAVRAALRRPDCFDGAVALSGPLTDHRLAPAQPGHAADRARMFLYASREEASTILDDGISLLDATTRTGDELSAQGHTVRCSYGDGGHTYAAWQAVLPDATAWVLDVQRP